MVRFKILKGFGDYRQGEIVDIDDDSRSKFLRSLGLIESVE
jgi:hypothetical protein